MSTLVVGAKFAPKGWKADPRFVYVGRGRGGKVTPTIAGGGYFGNPFPIGSGIDRDEAVALFRESCENRLVDDPDYRRAVAGLAGRTLVCYCAPKGGLRHTDPHVCHGQVLAEIAERMAGEVAR